MTSEPRARAARRFSLRWLGLALLLGALLVLAPYLGSSTELVRLRHALSLGTDLPLGTDWTPLDVPPDYLLGQAGPDPYFREVVSHLGLAALPDDWQRGLAISRHLLGSAPVLMGGAIQKNLRRTHQAIVGRGDGYCGDFVRSYIALAQAAGMTVRSWAFSFDGYGGHGHIWVELWNRSRGRWQLQDIFNNAYYVLGDGEPLSALELRAALLAPSANLQMRRLHADARPGYAIESKAWDYLRRGLGQWYMPWGNNVFEQDAAWPVRAFSGWSRMGEGLGAVVSGTSPSIRMLGTAGSEQDRQAMHSLQRRLYFAVVLGAGGLLLVVFGPLIQHGRIRASTQAQADAPQAAWPHVCIVGPLPPPSGGMANQCEQLQRLLRDEGAPLSFVRTNSPVWPAWAGEVPLVRAGLRLVAYVVALWGGMARAQVVHVFANSGWAWHLLAAPALGVARLRGVPAIVNYRGGLADEFFSAAPRHVLRSLAAAAERVTPSAFLERVFARHGLSARVIPNIIDLTRFRARPWQAAGPQAQIVVTRNLEAIYDIPSALRAFAFVRLQWPQARLAVAGSGPEREALLALAQELQLGESVRFTGRLDNADIAALYAGADVVLNPSTADNMPISLLEALASGVPVVSTRAGGIPDLVQHEHTALLVPVGDARAMADAVLRVLGDGALAQRLRDAGLKEVARYAWPQVREQWRAAYQRAASTHYPNASGHAPELPG